MAILEDIQGSRQCLQQLALEGVAGADLDGIKVRKYVQLGQRNTGQAVDPNGITDNHGIEPAAAAGASGGCAKFRACLTQLFAGFLQQFGRKGSAAYPGNIGLGYADDLMDVARAGARTGAGAAGTG